MSERASITAKTPEAKSNKPASKSQETDFSQSTNSPADHILFLQRTIGNQAVQRLLKSGVIQAKLKIGQPNDIYEQEAYRVADEVMRMPEPQVQRQVEPEEEEENLQAKPLVNQITPLVQKQLEPEEEEEEPLQAKPLADQITPLVQRQVEEEEEELQAKVVSGQTTEVNPNLESRINVLRGGGGQPLPETARAFFETRFGYDFSQVRVHTGSTANTTAKAVNANAFKGVRLSLYSPNSPVDQIFLLQRTIGNKAVQGLINSGFVQPKPKTSQSNDEFEQEADEIAERVMKMLATRYSAYDSHIKVQQKSNVSTKLAPGKRPKHRGDEIEKIYRKPGTPVVRRQTSERMDRRRAMRNTASNMGGPDAEPADLALRLSAMEGRGQPLPPSSRGYFESRFGHDFSHVRIHPHGAANELANDLNARAFTYGSNIFFRNDEYQPESQQGKHLLAHELAHVIQQRQTPKPLVQRLNEQEDPSRFRRIHERLFITTRSGRPPRIWVNSLEGQPLTGTAGAIIRQFRTYLAGQARQDRRLDNPTPSVSGTTLESQVESESIIADRRIRTHFSHITTPLSEAVIRGAVTIMTTSRVLTNRVLREWIANKISDERITDINLYNIHETDRRYQDMLTVMLDDPTDGRRIRNMVSLQAAFVEPTPTGRLVHVHPGDTPDGRRGTLVHELVHLYSSRDYKDWINSTREPRYFDEGFTEYLTRQVLRANRDNDAISIRQSYNNRARFIETEIARYIPDSDIERAYFRGEVWRIEGSSTVSQRIFGRQGPDRQVGIREGATRTEEITQSLTSPGIVQTVTEGRHYRFMNLGVNQQTPKPEHIAFFREIHTRHIAGHPNVRIRFVGHASTEGSSAHNLRLSRRRSATFYRIARDVGIPNSQLVDAARPPHSGERTLTAEELGVHGRAFNRRVELFLTGQSRASGESAD